jgi:hypothetical protein
LLEGNVVDASPAGAGGCKLLPEETEGKRNGVALLLPLSDVDAANVITFEVVDFSLLSKENEGHGKSRTIL